MEVTCDYCGQRAHLVTGADIYRGRHDLQHLNFWRCDPCDAHVGCHLKGSREGKTYHTGLEPIGRLADAELRRAKSHAHDAFDPMWRKGSMGRKQAYEWLARRMGIPVEECHIGKFDLDQCKAVVGIMWAVAV